MRLFKHSLSFFLVGLLGAISSWWIVALFGPKALGELLKYGSFLFTISGAVVKFYANSCDKSSDLRKFDHLSRETYAAGLSEIRVLVISRMWIGIAAAVVCLASGVILINSTSGDFTEIIALLGGFSFAAGCHMLLGLILAVLMLEDFRVSLKTIADGEASNREKIAVYDAPNLEHHS